MHPDDHQRERDDGVNGVPQRPRFWIVGGALLGVVLVILAGAYLLDRRARPQTGIEMSAGITEVVQTATQAGASPTFPSAPSTPTLAAATASPAVRVASSPLEREIEEAYFRYWELLAYAYLNLDTTRLAEVTSGAELKRQEQQVNELKRQVRAAKLIADHNVTFVEVTPLRAVIYDEYLNHSTFVDPVTKQPLPTNEPPMTEKISFQMNKIDGVWKIVDGLRHE